MTDTARPAVPAAAPDRPAVAPVPAPDVDEVAAQAVRSTRIDRALRAIEDLARQRRAHELVEAIERLGAGLGTTLDALDEVVGSGAPEEPAARPALVAVPDPVEPAADPSPLADAAPLVVATEPVAVPAPAAPVEAATPDRARRQAPADLAAFVIDFDAPVL
jgi:hypothetical protein